MCDFSKLPPAAQQLQKDRGGQGFELRVIRGKMGLFESGTRCRV